MGTDRIIAPMLDKSIVQQVFFGYYFRPDSPIQQLIHAMKYQGFPTLGVRLGERIGERLMQSPLIRQIDWLIPMPIHGSRFRERRYNQSERIAKGIASRTGIAIVHNAVKREIRTVPQAGLNAQQRTDNIKDAFIAGKKYIPDGICVGLVDDVITTGATINECARTLYNTGVKNIVAISIAAA